MVKIKSKYLNALKENLKKNKSLLAFNIQNINQLNSLSMACNKLKKKAIAQFSSRYISYFDKNFDFLSIVKKYKPNGIFFHLDHCQDVKIIKRCINLNFDGVMFDGSSLILKDNIRLTNKIFKKYSYPNNIVLEAEIGKVKGEEDGIKFSKNKLNKKEIDHFLLKANFNILALGAGNEHGINKNKKINQDLYKYALNIKNDLMLVFHGGSGITFEKLKKFQKYNIIKINFSSILKKKMTELNKRFSAKNKLYDQKKYDFFIEKNLFIFFKKFLKKF